MKIKPLLQNGCFVIPALISIFIGFLFLFDIFDILLFFILIFCLGLFFDCLILVVFYLNPEGKHEKMESEENNKLEEKNLTER